MGRGASRLLLGGVRTVSSVRRKSSSANGVPVAAIDAPCGPRTSLADSGDADARCGLRRGAGWGSAALIASSFERSRFAAAARVYNPSMAGKESANLRGAWSAEEIARNERANESREERDREKTREQRLEETVRLSRFVSELRDGLPDDVRA